MSGAAGTVGRPMKYPYTLTAKVAQFPFKWHINNQWIWKYYLVGVAICTPLFYKIQKGANSPANKAKWAESQQKSGH